MGLWLDRGRECDNLRQAIEIQINHYLCGTDNPVSVALNTPLDRPIDRALRGFFIQFCYPSVTRTSKCRSLVANKPICNSELQPILERSHRFCIGKDAYYQDSNIVWIDNPYQHISNDFLYHLLANVDWRKLNSTTIIRIYNDDLRNLKLSYPQIEEQKKISHLLSLFDERIATQNKIIEKLQSLIKGIAQHCIKESTSGNTYVKLGDICQITTGKLDANAQVDNGIYPFFTCAEQPFKIDSFAFDTEALLISGNGANLGYINYYKGKFNAYQRTYVLDLFSENIQYIKWALKVLLPKRIAIEKSSSNTPYIVLSTLTDLRLPIPCKSKQSFIANLMQSLERKLSNQIAQYDSYNYLKQYLLRQMFI